LNDLPKPKDFKDIENSVGETPTIEEFTPYPIAGQTESEPSDNQ